MSHSDYEHQLDLDDMDLDDLAEDGFGEDDLDDDDAIDESLEFERDQERRERKFDAEQQRYRDEDELRYAEFMAFDLAQSVGTDDAQERFRDLLGLSPCAAQYLLDHLLTLDYDDRCDLLCQMIGC